MTEQAVDIGKIELTVNSGQTVPAVSNAEITKDIIINKVSEQVVWWLGERRLKFSELKHTAMGRNPFLLPIVMEMHGFKNFTELADFALGGHFLISHATGFGKLMDEKILPAVFGTQKLTAAYRSQVPILKSSCFNEIDHIVTRANGDRELLSLKAGKWTIQLTMAVQLNHAFNEILQLKRDKKIEFKKISVGIFYGNSSDLTDKYEILQGINRGANHDVIDIKKDVSVIAGREFWAWLNSGEQETQSWVLAGILEGVAIDTKTNGKLESLITAYKESFIEEHKKYVDKDGNIMWESMLTSING